MSVAYEPRSFTDDSPYAPVGENEHDLNKYINSEANVADMADLAAATYEPTDDTPPAEFHPSPSPALDLSPVAPPNVDPANASVRDISSPAMHNAFSPVDLTTMRSKSVAKPYREITKNSEGSFVCTWPDCKDFHKKFIRKCEWSKHMDKHERPYICTVPGCEKVQGFTYSGGLLRHEREVHGKHGGPKKKLLCPHETCKRSSGKGFSRQENLAEHLRRVHTPACPIPADSPVENHTDDSASDVASAAYAVLAAGAMIPADLECIGEVTSKRKRCLNDVGRAIYDHGDMDIRAENKRLRQENAEQARRLQEQSQQISEMRAQLQTITPLIEQLHAVGHSNDSLSLGLAPDAEL